MRNPKSEIPTSKNVPGSKSKYPSWMRGNAGLHVSGKEHRSAFWRLRFGICLGFGICHLGFSSARAQGTAFTYQGRLTDNSGALTGNYDFTFRLFDAATGGSNQGGPLTNSNVTLSDGLFTVALDFGVNPFSNGAARWVEI